MLSSTSDHVSMVSRVLHYIVQYLVFVFSVSSESIQAYCEYHGSIILVHILLSIYVLITYMFSMHIDPCSRMRDVSFHWWHTLRGVEATQLMPRPPLVSALYN